MTTLAVDRSRAPAAWVAVLSGLGFVAVCLLVVTATGLAHPDVSVARTVTDYTSVHPGYVDLSRWLTNAFSPTTFRVLGAIAVVVLLVRGDRRLALWAGVTLVAGGLLVLAVKEGVARHRPAPVHPIAHFGGYSFPSGHAANAALGCGVLLVIILPLLSRTARRIAWLLAAVIVIVTGGTRIALGAHYLSDVVAGWLLGVCIVATTYALMMPPPAAKKEPATKDKETTRG